MSADETAAPDRPHRRTRLLYWGIALVAIVLLLFGRSAVGWWAQRTASQYLEIGALSDAQQWLARAARFRPDHADTEVLLARTYRHLGQFDRWSELLTSIEASAADSEDVALEKRLGDLRWGRSGAIADNALARLTRAGVDIDEAATAIVFGHLGKGDEVRVQRVLERWESGEHQPAQVAYARGIYRQWKADYERAEEAFRIALASQPRHELAQLGLAQVLEHQGELEPSREYFSELVQRWPDSELARIGCSRVLRKLGRGERAQRLLERFESRDSVSREIALEMAEVQYQLGNYGEAIGWFERSDLVGSAHYLSTLRTAATAYAISGQTNPSRSLFKSIYATQSRSRRLEALRARVATDRSDTKAAAELQRVVAATVPIVVEPESPANDASALFSRHCAACHGEQGDGNGRAAGNLYPRPRDLRMDPYRLVRTTSRFPSPEDIQTVLRNGIPGTAMPSFDHLTEAQLGLLANKTHQLRRDGLRAQLVERFHRAGELLDRPMVDRLVQERTDPGAPLDASPTAPATVENLAAGKTLYHEMACDACHGTDGRGAEKTAFFDENGLPTIPRNLVDAPYKGGETPDALFARLRLGMPGTVHPANPTLSNHELAQLVAYCLSLSKQPKSSFTNRQRAMRANERAVQAGQSLKKSRSTTADLDE